MGKPDHAHRAPPPQLQRQAADNSRATSHANLDQQAGNGHVAAAAHITAQEQASAPHLGQIGWYDNTGGDALIADLVGTDCSFTTVPTYMDEKFPGRGEQYYQAYVNVVEKGGMETNVLEHFSSGNSQQTDYNLAMEIDFAYPSVPPLYANHIGGVVVGAGAIPPKSVRTEQIRQAERESQGRTNNARNRAIRSMIATEKIRPTPELDKEYGERVLSLKLKEYSDFGRMKFRLAAMKELRGSPAIIRLLSLFAAAKYTNQLLAHIDWCIDDEDGDDHREPLLLQRLQHSMHQFLLRLMSRLSLQTLPHIEGDKGLYVQLAILADSLTYASRHKPPANPYFECLALFGQFVATLSDERTRGQVSNDHSGTVKISAMNDQHQAQIVHPNMGQHLLCFFAFISFSSCFLCPSSSYIVRSPAPYIGTGTVLSPKHSSAASAINVAESTAASFMTLRHLQILANAVILAIVLVQYLPLVFNIGKYTEFTGKDDLGLLSFAGLFGDLLHLTRGLDMDCLREILDKPDGIRNLSVISKLRLYLLLGRRIKEEKNGAESASAWGQNEIEELRVVQGLLSHELFGTYYTGLPR